MALASVFGNAVGGVGKFLGLPELGVSEKISNIGGKSGKITNVYPNLSPNDALAKLKANGTGGNVLGASTSVPTTGVYSSATNSGAATRNVAPVQQEIRDRISRAQGIYNGLFGDTDSYLNDNRSRIDADTATQFDNADKAYQTTSQGLAQSYAGRGLGNSDYLTSAQNDAANEYQANRAAIAKGRDDAYAELGKYGQQQKSAFQSQLDALKGIDPSQLTNDDYDTAVSLRSQLDQILADAGQSKASLQPNGTFANSLKQVSGGNTAILTQAKDRLAKLAQSSASDLVKGQIASGYINSNSGLSDDEKKQLQTYYGALSTTKAS